MVRDVLGAAGAGLVQAGRLDRIDDVFFLDLADQESPGDLREVAARNRREYGRACTRGPCGSS